MKEEKKKKILLCGVIIFLGFILYFTSGSSQTKIPENRLFVGNKKGQSTEYVIDAKYGEKEVSSIEISLEPPDYTEEELLILFEECKEASVSKLLGENEDISMVTGDLNYFKELKGYPFSFEFECDDPGFIDEKGQLVTGEIFDTTVYITVGYKSFSEAFGIKIHAEPGQEIKEKLNRERVVGLIAEELENAMNMPGADDYASLPERLDGEIVTYNYSKKPRNPLYLAGSVVICVLLLFAFKRDKETKEAIFEKEILADYPLLLQKTTMYMSAGMTIRNIWPMVYEEAKRAGLENRPLYAEIGFLINELKSGLSEETVYREFGERTKTKETVRFSALLGRNTKNGDSKLANLLREEAENAFTGRKQRAVKAGEEAGTKLLFPMMVLLADMMAIIMVPAFISIM